MPMQYVQMFSMTFLFCALVRCRIFPFWFDFAFRQAHMGGQLGVHDAGQAELRGEPCDATGEISPEFRQRMHDTINDAHAISARPSEFVMPWEMPSMSWVFGDGDPFAIPDVTPVLGYVEPQPEPESSRPGPVIALVDKPTVFESAISFNSFRTCHLCEGDQLSMLAQKWEALISINYSAFNLGVGILDADFAERVEIVSEVLGGKSPATLSRRLSQAAKFARWATSDAKREPFPVTAELIKNCIGHLRNEGSGHTAFKGFVEVLKFMKHVVRLDCDLAAFDTAWVGGVIRAAQQARPLRRQSTTLNVKTLQFMESYLCDERHAMVDRYAVGVFLFAVYSRSRFGDLRKIAKIIFDAASDDTGESLGYIEMHSASHKMRATGNRLGAHLPLIAPIKGLSDIAWGREFAKVSKVAGLDICAWSDGNPLLPAPTQLGDWTDRSVTSSEVCKWIHGVLRSCQDFNPEGFTPHGCKATTLIMLSRYGATSDDRLVLGHHQLNRGALEVYARDLQSSPLRTLEQMFADIRKGRFSPDVTRSGMFTPVPVQTTVDASTPDWTRGPVRRSVSPTPTSPLDAPGEEPTPAQIELSLQDPGDPDEKQQALMLEGTVSDDSESDFCSDESDAEEIIKSMATSQKPTKHWHPGCSLYQHKRSKLVHALGTFGNRTAFVCGRPLSKEYKAFQADFFVDALKCQQCDKGQVQSQESERAAVTGAAVKRARRA